MKLYCNIFFLRHLKTKNNILHIISGQSDSEIVSENYMKEDFNKFDRIYCSPAIRCKRTIDLLAYGPFGTDNIIYDERLLERNMGNLEGVSKKEIRTEYLDLFENGSFNVFKTPPNGENYECFKNRVNDFYSELSSINIPLKILVCSHKQTLKLLRLLILEKEITNQTWSEYSFKNGVIDEICKC